MTAAARKSRCRMLNRMSNRCPNEAVTEYGLCAHDLAAAAAEFAAVTADAKPGLTLATLRAQAS